MNYYQKSYLFIVLIIQKDDSLHSINPIQLIVILFTEYLNEFYQINFRNLKLQKTNTFSQLLIIYFLFGQVNLRLQFQLGPGCLKKDFLLRLSCKLVMKEIKLY